MYSEKFVYPSHKTQKKGAFKNCSIQITFRLSSKQAELVALEEKKALLEKELEEWKEKVEEGTGDTSPLS